MSGQATGWVMRHGPCTTWAAAQGARKDRSGQAVLLAIADAANRDGENSHPGMAAMIDASGYARATVYTALDRLTADGWVEVTEDGTGRGKATIYRVPGVTDAEWRPNAGKVQILESNGAERGPDAEEERSRSAAKEVQISESAPITQRSTNGSTNVLMGLEASFAVFYETYPRSVKRVDALKAWRQVVKTDEQAAGVIAGAIAMRDWPHLRPKGYLPYPATWLRGECWGDDLNDTYPPCEPETKQDRSRLAGAQVVAAMRDPHYESTLDRMRRLGEPEPHELAASIASHPSSGALSPPPSLRVLVGGGGDPDPLESHTGGVS